MNKKILVTAVLASFTALLHLLSGTPEIEPPLLNAGLRPEISLLLLACWHLVSVTLAFSAIAYFVVAKHNTGKYHLMSQFISIIWISFGLVFIAVDLIYAGPQMLLALPQWILLIPIGLLGLWGSTPREYTDS